MRLGEGERAERCRVSESKRLVRMLASHLSAFGEISSERARWSRSSGERSRRWGKSLLSNSSFRASFCSAASVVIHK